MNDGMCTKSHKKELCKKVKIHKLCLKILHVKMNESCKKKKNLPQNLWAINESLYKSHMKKWINANNHSMNQWKNQIWIFFKDHMKTKITCQPSEKKDESHAKTSH